MEVNGNIIKFENTLCFYKRIFTIKVFESINNSNKPFYCYKYNECPFSRFWSSSEHNFKSGAMFMEDANDIKENQFVYKMIREIKLM